MGFVRRHPVIFLCCGVLLLFALIVVWSMSGPSAAARYEQIQAGMREEEVEAIWGPPVYVGTDPQAFGGGPIRMQIDYPNGERIRIKWEKAWWYDDDHVFWVYFDERGVVVCKSGVVGNVPRSQLGRLRRDIRGIFN